jgi:alcohol dehydrogenase class IV
VTLPATVEFNHELCAERYGSLTPGLSAKLRDFAAAGGLPARLRDLGAEEPHLEELAADAATQWTGRHNPRPFDESSALEMYCCAY